MLFGRSHFYVIDGYTLMNTHEIVDIGALPTSMQHTPIVPTTGGADTGKWGTTSPTSAVAMGKRSNRSYSSDLVSSGAVEQISGNQ